VKQHPCSHRLQRSSLPLKFNYGIVNSFTRGSGSVICSINTAELLARLSWQHVHKLSLQTPEGVYPLKVQWRERLSVSTSWSDIH
jgi:hypothetical protein